MLSHHFISCQALIARLYELARVSPVWISLSTIELDEWYALCDDRRAKATKAVDLLFDPRGWSCAAIVRAIRLRPAKAQYEAEYLRALHLAAKMRGLMLDEKTIDDPSTVDYPRAHVARSRKSLKSLFDISSMKSGEEKAEPEKRPVNSDWSVIAAETGMLWQRDDAKTAGRIKRWMASMRSYAAKAGRTGSEMCRAIADGIKMLGLGPTTRAIADDLVTTGQLDRYVTGRLRRVGSAQAPMAGGNGYGRTGSDAHKRGETQTDQHASYQRWSGLDTPVTKGNQPTSWLDQLGAIGVGARAIRQERELMAA
jgi:hypothetical protein